MDFSLDEMKEITMTQTGLIPGKKGSVVHVLFEREKGKKKDIAEIVMPSGRVVNVNGFEEKEMAHLQLYLKMHKQEIFTSAKKINHDLIFKL